MNRSNVAILTFCNDSGSVNYGQILQCYAAQNLFENMGVKVKVIFYQRLSVNELPTARVRRFKKFISEHIHISEHCNSLEELEMIIKDCRVVDFGAKDIKTILTPIFLLPLEKWDTLLLKQQDSKNYIFCYCAEGVRPYSLVLRKLSEWYENAEIIYIPTSLLDEMGYGFMTPIYDAGPTEFLTLVKNARAVVTDSFYGIAFSIMFQRDWYCMKCYGKDTKCFSERARIDQLTDGVGAVRGWVSNVNEARQRYAVCQEGLRYPEIERMFDAAVKSWEV